MATQGTRADPHIINICGDGMSKGVVIGSVPGSTEYLKQSSADMTKWVFYDEPKKHESNLCLRARLKNVLPDLARIWRTHELLPGGMPATPPVFVRCLWTSALPLTARSCATRRA